MRHDFASKHWLRKYRRPLWACIVRAWHARVSRRQQTGDALHRGIQIRCAPEGSYIEPRPAGHRN
jgi:hypothetical protein